MPKPFHTRAQRKVGRDRAVYRVVMSLRKPADFTSGGMEGFQLLCCFTINSRLLSIRRVFAGYLDRVVQRLDTVSLRTDVPRDIGRFVVPAGRQRFTTPRA